MFPDTNCLQFLDKARRGTVCHSRLHPYLDHMREDTHKAGLSQRVRRQPFPGFPQAFRRSHRLALKIFKFTTSAGFGARQPRGARAGVGFPTAIAGPCRLDTLNVLSYRTAIDAAKTGARAKNGGYDDGGEN